MRNMHSLKTIFFCSMALLITMPNIASAKALRSPVQTGDNIIIAKGDIPTPEKYHAAIQNYLQFTQKQLQQMVVQLEALDDYLKKGDLTGAQQAYIHAHQYYESVRPIIILFGNTDRTINPRADYFLDGEKDYRFSGFHLVEYQLFERKDRKATLIATDELLLKARDLEKRVASETVEIPKLVQAAADFIEMILETKLAGKENIYSQSDLADIAANLQGSQEIITVLHPFIPPKTLQAIQLNDQTTDKILKRYRSSTGVYQPYSQLSQQDKMALYSVLTQQAENLAQLRSQLSVDVYYKY